MPLALVGLNHRTAPVALRELFALTPDAQRALLDRAADSADHGVAALAVLSTCNRTELYGTALAERDLSAVPPVLASMLSGLTSQPLDLTHSLYEAQGAAAVRHLCRVAAGLDSMVPGESEILGQVAQAHELALAERPAPVLDAAFRAARRAGRRARVETGVARGATGVGGEAARLLADLAGDLTGVSVLIVGTGKMGRLAGQALLGRGARRITVVSRTTEHAAALADQLGAAALAWHDLPAALARADAILCATGAPHAVITREVMVHAIGPSGDGRRRVIVDVAVPRDVEAAVGELPGVTLWNFDDLQRRLEGALEQRREAFPEVERIVDEEVAQFEAWERGWALRPLLTAMRERGETIRRREVERLLHRLGNVPDDVRRQLEQFSESLVTKLLHEPTRRLRAADDPAQAAEYARLARELFGLSEPT